MLKMSLYEKDRAGFFDFLIACSCEDEAAARATSLFKHVP